MVDKKIKDSIENKDRSIKENISEDNAKSVIININFDKFPFSDHKTQIFQFNRLTLFLYCSQPIKQMSLLKQSVQSYARVLSVYPAECS